MAPPRINTYVFFDLEGTGLTDNPRVTEITMLAMHRLAGEEMVYRARKMMWAPGGSDPPPDLPRVINKLTIAIYPMKPIQFEAAEITGLNNDNLYQQKDFDPEVGELLCLYLRRLEPPVCLVAHNGHRFDFPLLLAELQSTGCSPLTLANDEPVLCLDTFEMFRDLDGDPVNFPNRYLRPADEVPPPSADPVTNGNGKKQSNGDDGKRSGQGDESSQDVNEKTPEDKKDFPIHIKVEIPDSDDEGEAVGRNASSVVRARRRLFVEDDNSNDGAGTSHDGANTAGAETVIDDDDIPDSALLNVDVDVKPIISNGSSKINKSTEPPPPKKSLIRPVRPPAPAPPPTPEVEPIPLRPLCGKTHFKPRINAVMRVATRPSYKLIDLHQRIIGFEPVDSHRAEDDCVTLARIFWLTPKATTWADRNAVPFDRFRPLYVRPRKPLPPGKFPCSN